MTIGNLLTVEEAANQARLSHHRIRQLLRAGSIIGVRPGRSGNWRIPCSSLDQYLQGGPAPIPQSR